jgi:3-isopropylmalate/(R)-2-methylmalate dehydratase small subunit
MTPAQAGDARIVRVTGQGLVLRGDDIDTDRIMPARFLRAVSFDGLEAHVFEDDRRAAAAAGETHPFDRPGSTRPSILLVNKNFGCGSSREHAPQGIVRWGMRAIVGESFAEIFFGNATALGLPCVSADAEVIRDLMAAVEAAPDTRLLIDVETLRIEAGGSRWPIALPAAAREAFLHGTWDATALLAASLSDVRLVAGRIPYLTGF